MGITCMLVYNSKRDGAYLADNKVIQVLYDFVFTLTLKITQTHDFCFLHKGKNIFEASNSHTFSPHLLHLSSAQCLIEEEWVMVGGRA